MKFPHVILKMWWELRKGILIKIKEDLLFIFTLS
jgi:hypothetical protein